MTNSRILISLLGLSLVASIMTANVIMANDSIIFAQQEERYSFVKKWGSEGSGDGQFKKPEDIAIDSKTENVYVTDTKNSRIQVFAPLN